MRSQESEPKVTKLVGVVEAQLNNLPIAINFRQYFYLQRALFTWMLLIVVAALFAVKNAARFAV